MIRSRNVSQNTSKAITVSIFFEIKGSLNADFYPCFNINDDFYKFVAQQKWFVCLIFICQHSNTKYTGQSVLCLFVCLLVHNCDTTHTVTQIFFRWHTVGDVFFLTTLQGMLGKIKKKSELFWHLFAKDETLSDEISAIQTKTFPVSWLLIFLGPWVGGLGKWSPADLSRG